MHSPRSCSPPGPSPRAISRRDVLRDRRVNVCLLAWIALPSRVSHTRPRVHAIELKVPPVALVIIAAFFIWLGAAYAPGLSFELPLRSTIAWGFGLLGATTSALGVREFKRSKNTVNPTKPESSSTLVRSGIYRYTRNPMYLGFLLILIGCAIAAANVVAFVVLLRFVGYMNRFQIEPEERALTLIFGEDFKAFCFEARRWI